MSTTAVQEFLGKVAEDKELQGEMAKALESENDREAVTALALAKGYEFTTEELWQEVQARQEAVKQRMDAGELSDEELQAVAGGEVLSATVGASMLVTAISAVGGGAISAAISASVGSMAKW